MGKATVAREYDLIDRHDVMIALSRASAALALLDELTNSGHDGGWFNDGRTDKGLAALGTTRKEARDWTIDMAVNALAAALGEARDAFRKSLTPEQAKEQIIGGPKAVA